MKDYNKTTWPAYTRIFHWINVVLVLTISYYGLTIMFGEVDALEKIELKDNHFFIGVAFSINLIIRILVSFISNNPALSFSEINPFTKKNLHELSDVISNKKIGEHEYHNPIGRLMVFSLYLVMSIQMLSGMVVSGTDIYRGPLGEHFLSKVSTGMDAEAIVNNRQDKSLINKEEYSKMREMRKPIAETHEMGAFILFGLIFLHIFGVIFESRRSKINLPKSMITGIRE